MGQGWNVQNRGLVQTSFLYFILELLLVVKVVITSISTIVHPRVGEGACVYCLGEVGPTYHLTPIHGPATLDR